MRDVDIEARLRSALRADAETLPFSITHTELERRLALRRRARDGRRLSLVAAGVAALAVGSIVVLANGWLRTPPVGQSSPAAVIPPSSHEPAIATAPSATADAPAATDEVAPECVQIDPEQLMVPPDLLATMVPSEIGLRTGLLDSFILGTFGSVDPSRWRVPDPDGSSLLPARPSNRLRFVIGGPYACVTRLTVDAARLDPSGALPLDPSGQPAGGSSRLADLGEVGNHQLLVDLPSGPGRWVLRAFATFATTSGTAQSVSFFLVDTLEPGASAPTPTAPPSGLASLPPPAGTRFVDRDDTTSGPGGPIPEVDGQSDPGQFYDLGELPHRPTYQLVTACLGNRSVFWSIGRDQEPGTLTYHDVRCDGAPQTVDVSLGTPTMPLHLFVGVLDNGDVSQPTQASRWHIQVSSDDPAPGFIPPAAGRGRRLRRIRERHDLLSAVPKARRRRRPVPRHVRDPVRGRHRDHPGRRRPRPRAPRGLDHRADRGRRGADQPHLPGSVAGGRSSGHLDRHARRLPRARRARRRPGTRRLDAARAHHRDGQGSYGQRLVRRPDPHRALTARAPAPRPGPAPRAGRAASARLRLPWGYSSAGRAPAWHAGGPGFESP